MNVATQAALAAEYKIREWYHGLAERGTKFSDVKCQVAYLFTSEFWSDNFISWKKKK